MVVLLAMVFVVRGFSPAVVVAVLPSFCVLAKMR